MQDGKEGRKEGRKGLTLEIDRWRCVPKLSSGFAFPLGDLVRARPEEKKYMLPRSPPPEVSLAHRVRARACKLCSSTHMSPIARSCCDIAKGKNFTLCDIAATSSNWTIETKISSSDSDLNNLSRVRMADAHLIML